MRHSVSKSSVTTDTSSTSKATDSSSSLISPSTSTLTVDVVSATAVNETGIPTPMPMMRAVNAVLMERTPFAIDDAKEDEEDDEDLDGDANDEGVMDEVGNFPESRLEGILKLFEGGCLPRGSRFRVD